MIPRALVMAGCLFSLYNFFLIIPGVQALYTQSQGQFQSNIIKAQEYTASPSTRRVVIVGSSMSSLLPEKLLGNDVLNLAFAGGGPLTGLALIGCHDNKPKVVAVEINRMLVAEDAELVDDACSPFQTPLRQWVPAMREKFEPSNLVGGRLFRDSLRRIELLLKSETPAIGAAALAQRTRTGGDTSALAQKTAVRAPTTYDQLLAENRRSLSVMPSAKALDNALGRAAAQVNALEHSGVSIVFFEMPVEHSLKGLLPAVTLRRATELQFPPSRYRWLTPCCEPVTTVDGLHLAGRSVSVASQWLRRGLVELANDPVAH